MTKSRWAILIAMLIITVFSQIATPALANKNLPALQQRLAYLEAEKQKVETYFFSAVQDRKLTVEEMKKLSQLVNDFERRAKESREMYGERSIGISLVAGLVGGVTIYNNSSPCWRGIGNKERIMSALSKAGATDILQLDTYFDFSVFRIIFAIFIISALILCWSVSTAATALSMIMFTIALMSFCLLIFISLPI